jgi:hypothetical protein
VRKRTILKLYNITGEDWKKVKREVVKLLAVRGVKVHKWDNWTYRIIGVETSGSHEMTIPLFVKIDSETMAKPEELSRRKSVNKAELVREAIKEYLVKQA